MKPKSARRYMQLAHMTSQLEGVPLATGEIKRRNLHPCLCFECLNTERYEEENCQEANVFGDHLHVFA